MAAPFSADLGPTHLDPVRGAGTTASFDLTAAVSGSCRPALAASSTELLGQRNCPTPDLSVTPLLCWSKGGSSLRCDTHRSSHPFVPKTNVRDGWVGCHVVRELCFSARTKKRSRKVRNETRTHTTSTPTNTAQHDTTTTPRSTQPQNITQHQQHHTTEKTHYTHHTLPLSSRTEREETDI